MIATQKLKNNVINPDKKERLQKSIIQLKINLFAIFFHYYYLPILSFENKYCT